MSLSTARRACAALLEAKDRSSFVLSKYIPEYARDGFLALRALNVETAKIVDSSRDPRVAAVRLQYWKTAIQQIKGDASVKEVEQPVIQLLQSAAVSGVPVAKRYLLTLLQTRETQLAEPPVRTTEDLARMGEGVHSQLLYATLDMLQSREPETQRFLAEHEQLDDLASRLLAHIGQATGIASALRTLPFFAAKRNFVSMPNAVLREHGITAQQVVDLVTENTPLPALKDAVFDVATAANDHILSARSLLSEFKETTDGAVPQSLVLSAMGAVPVSLYLERLEKYDFDIIKTTHLAEWKLPWRSWRAFKTKSI